MILGDEVTSIGYYAFSGCSGLTSVISKIVNPPSYINISTFDRSVYDNATLWVPAGTIDKYKNTSCWNYFKNIKEGEPTGISTVMTTSEKPFDVYDINGRKVRSQVTSFEGLSKGINIVKMSDGSTRKVMVK